MNLDKIWGWVLAGLGVCVIIWDGITWPFRMIGKGIAWLYHKIFGKEAEEELRGSTGWNDEYPHMKVEEDEHE